MDKEKAQMNLFVLVTLVSLVVAIVALHQADTAQKLALSEISVEEQNALITPVFDQASKSWSFIALYELGLTNHSGPVVSLAKLEKLNDGSGFLVALDGENVVDEKIEYSAFVFEKTISQIKADPRLLKSIVGSDMGSEAVVNLPIESGESKPLRFGLSVKAYDQSGIAVANMLLASFRLVFDSGKTFVFKRAIPVPPLKPVSQ